MRHKVVLSLAALAAVWGALSALQAASRNLAPDAVSRASTWNEHTGDVAWLTDGLIPPSEQEAARPFVWSSKGMLAFEWDQVLPIAQVRVCVGAADSDFEVRTYVGGRLQEDGSTRDPQGERTATVADHSGASNTWIVFDLPAGTQADNLELKTQGPTEIYEVEILADLGPDVTAVRGSSWGRIKAAARAFSL